MMTGFPLLLATRLDWGFGNPNKTAAFVAVLMVGVWIFAWMRAWGFWVSLVACAGLGICLLLTGSRGGLLAAVAGLACVLGHAPRPWPKAKVFAVAMALAGLTLCALKQTTASRYVQGIDSEDRSISNRLLIWKQVPRMILDAPGGWGFGNAGWAYMEWYQPIGRLEGYRTLVSSHLTWLVEGNWLVRVGYVLGWCAAFVICWPSAKNRSFGVALGIWAAFWIGGFFSSVAESPWMWVLPLWSLAPVFFFRFEQKWWPSCQAWIGAVAGTFAVLTLLGVCLVEAGPSQAQPIRGDSREVKLGASTPAFWVVAPDLKVVGLHYGQELRREQLSVVVHLANDLPADASGTVALTGALPTATSVGACRQILLLNPPPLPDDANAFLNSLEGRQITVMWGEFRDDPGCRGWEELARNNQAVHFMEIPGTALYCSHWAKLLRQATSETVKRVDGRGEKITSVH